MEGPHTKMEKKCEEEGEAEELLWSDRSPPLVEMQGKSILELHKTYDGMFR